MKSVMIWRGSLAVLLAFWVGLLGSVPRVALAELVPARSAIEAEPRSESPRQRVDDLLRREDVREQFRALGVDPEEARRRVSALSDDEIARLDARLGDLPAGQSFLGTVAGLILLIFLLLLITDLLGATDVFPVIRPLSGNAASR